MHVVIKYLREIFAYLYSSVFVVSSQAKVSSESMQSPQRGWKGQQARHRRHLKMLHKSAYDHTSTHLLANGTVRRATACSNVHRVFYSPPSLSLNLSLTAYLLPPTSYLPTSPTQH